MKSKIKAAGFSISIIAIILLTAGAVFLVSPALLYVVGIQYKSIKMLIVFVVVVLAATSVFQFLMEGIYLVAIKNKIVRINEDNLGFLIFNIISTFVIVLYIDFLMESIEISMFSAAIYSVLYCLAIKILDILADSLDDEDTDIQGE